MAGGPWAQAALHLRAESCRGRRRRSIAARAGRCPAGTSSSLSIVRFRLTSESQKPHSSPSQLMQSSSSDKREVSKMNVIGKAKRDRATIGPCNHNIDRSQASRVRRLREVSQDGLEHLEASEQILALEERVEAERAQVEGDEPGEDRADLLVELEHLARELLVHLLLRGALDCAAKEGQALAAVVAHGDARRRQADKRAVHQKVVGVCNELAKSRARREVGDEAEHAHGDPRDDERGHDERDRLVHVHQVGLRDAPLLPLLLGGVLSHFHRSHDDEGPHGHGPVEPGLRDVVRLHTGRVREIGGRTRGNVVDGASAVSVEQRERVARAWASARGQRRRAGIGNAAMNPRCEEPNGAKG
eukprot:CAMPEP_0206011262 /NCGR_PEP_ID=MMETSP1464-20131121/12970_1 /ASSEMBLY_ACC=CAM_ASM_001124 /TAXON_ID=119497 /ORGANISM="Exanthemachrysis gayraliae, Strain RCC1523" /LENGTH=358 /DNA_ID=CAMNT_0053384917 /DNA_START=348 /DNA_END=1423 /DNA_ORIENTATION=-